MKVYKQIFISLDESERYEAPYGPSGRRFEVRQVYVTFNSDGEINHIQESGPMILLRGGFSVDEWGGCRFPKSTEPLPEHVRKAIEETRC